MIGVPMRGGPLRGRGDTLDIIGIAMMLREPKSPLRGFEWETWVHAEGPRLGSLATPRVKLEDAPTR